jgi:hypothetical protein
MAIKAIVVNNKVNAVTVGRPGLKGNKGDEGPPQDITGKLDKIAAISDYVVNFSSAVIASGETVSCSAALTITLETYTSRVEGEQFAVMAVGGDVTFAGTFVGQGGFTVLAQGSIAYVVRDALSWRVFGVTA